MGNSFGANRFSIGSSRRRCTPESAHASSHPATGPPQGENTNLLEFEQHNMRLTCPEDLCRVLYPVHKQRLPCLRLTSILLPSGEVNLYLPSLMATAT